MDNRDLLNTWNYDFLPISKVIEIPIGKRKFVTINGIPIVVLNITGKIYAIADSCSHDEGPLGDGDIEGYEINCPRHGARFDIRTGKALSLPAVVNIPVYPIRIMDGNIEVGFPRGT